ncbi:MAG: hypothetical protein IJV16_10845 [Lachnospiraceae bacterium]|nr:hypothetical protein [Lachnospiraceae bacterium]
MIDPYEKILMVMRGQGKTEAPLLTGILKPNGNCNIGDLVLEPDDYDSLAVESEENEGRLEKITTDTDVEVLIASIDDRLIILGKVV